MDEENKKDIHSIACRYFEGSLNPEEEKVLFDFLQADDKNMQQFRTWEEEWLDRQHNLYLDNRWKRLSGRLAAQENLPLKNHRSLIRRVLPYAAVFLIGLLISTAAVALLDKEAEGVLAQSEFFVPYGSQSQLTLPDGSTVWLNAGSTLRYDNSFGRDNRAVYLEGEGVFDVVKQTGVPFTVGNDRMTVTVYGTMFNVSSFAGDSLSTVDLLRGHVAVSYPFGTEPEGLLPGERLVIDNASRTTVKETFDPDSYLSWHDGVLAFCDEPLADIAKKLERKFNLRIHITDDSLATRRYYLTFGNHESVDQILETMRQDPKLHIKRKGNTIEIY